MTDTTVFPKRTMPKVENQPLTSIGTPISPPPIPDRLAGAIAEVQAMKDLIEEQRKTIDSYVRSNTTLQDRVTLLTEERARWRTDAMACRTFVVKLATILEHVHTATSGCAAILDDMAAMDASETSKESIDETERSVKENLKKIQGVTGGKASVETVSEGAPSNP